MADPKTTLYDLMSAVSEDYWFAGWLSSLEYDLWRMVEGGERSYGIGVVTEHEVSELRRLSAEAGGWFKWSDDAGDAVFVPLNEWVAALQAQGSPTHD